jgi:hypothetical protein
MAASGRYPPVDLGDFCPFEWQISVRGDVRFSASGIRGRKRLIYPHKANLRLNWV